MATSGISGFGTTLAGGSAGTIGMITKLSITGLEVNDIDITTMESPDGWREFIAGLKDAKEIQCDMLYENNNMDTILAALGDVNETWTITLPDGATFVCDGYIKAVGGVGIPMDDKISQTFSIKLSGAPTFTPGAS
jgi:predicted secreted protein